MLSSTFLQDSLHRVSVGFRSLNDSPSELWKAYALKFLDSYSYFSFSIIFTLFASQEFGYSDVGAGTLYGAWGALVTVYGVVTGTIVDNLGVANSLRLGFGLSLVSRICLLMTTSRAVLVANICLLLPLSNCLGIPVLTTGIRRYTNEGNRGFAFGLFYVIMNVAALMSGPVVDWFTVGYDENSAANTQTEFHLTGYRSVILTGVVANVVACAVAFSVREIRVTQTAPDTAASSQPLDKDSDHDVNGNLRSTQDTKSQAEISSFRVQKANSRKILLETLRQPQFWRFLVVCLITVNVRMIFRHLDATLPKYMLREFGPNVAKGAIYSINPALIIVLVPIVTAMTTTVAPLFMIHHGSYISALSVFFLVFSTSVPACVLFVIMLSIGEAIWSPRLYDYTMSVAPEGREGTYMALSSAPLFLAKLPVGFLSGILLERYCPAGETVERHSQTMWLIVGVSTIISPILMTTCWSYISRKENDEGGGYSTELQRYDDSRSSGNILNRRPSQSSLT